MSTKPFQERFKPGSFISWRITMSIFKFNTMNPIHSVSFYKLDPMIPVLLIAVNVKYPSFITTMFMYKGELFGCRFYDRSPCAEACQLLTIV